ncbi:MAG TPA: DUF58 domain-containing protein [Tepidisphaeraceae bacterium]|jgi:uncharacterized protein (DUF58 family)
MSLPNITNYRKYLDPRTLARVGSLDLRARLIVEGLMTGMHRSPYQGASVEFAQHRPYAFGDDIRSVDWKVLAKTDRVYLKQYIEETNLHLICVVDASESMGFGSVGEGSGFGVQGSGTHWSKFDHATAIAAALAYMAIQQQDSVGLAVFDRELKKYLKPSNSPAQWKTITQELTIVPRRAKTGTGHVLDQLAEKLTHRSLIVVLSDFFDDMKGIAQGLRHLRYRKHEVMVFQVLDPLEIEFPYEDVTLFKGLEESGELLTEPRSLREGYLEQLSQFTEEMKKMCRGMHIDFTRMSSGEPLDVTLSGFLATRAASIK